MDPRISSGVQNIGQEYDHEFWSSQTGSTHARDQRLGQPMFLRSFHDENDSASARELDRFKFAPLTAQQHHHFKTDFNVDVDLIRRLWTDA